MATALPPTSMSENRAAALIKRIIRFAADYRRPMDLAEAKTLQACLEWMTGSHAEAAVILEETMAALQDKGIIRVIADEGAAVVPILKRAAASVSAEGYSGNLDRTYVTEVLLAAHSVAKRQRGITASFKKSGKPVKLSRQQKKMLQMLAQGYKNQEIAQITGIALPTVKGHLTQAYEKLGVHNAMDALLKARELALL